MDRAMPVFVYGICLLVGGAGLAWAAPALREAFASRSIPGAIFVTFLGVVFLAFAVAGLRGLAAQFRRGTDGEATRGIVADGRPGANWEAAFWINAFTLPMALGAGWVATHVGDTFAATVGSILGIVFFLSGLSWGIAAVRRSEQWSVFGEAVLRLSSPSLRTGGIVEGAIGFERGIGSGVPVRATLLCRRRPRRASFRHTLWEAQVETLTVRGPQGVELPVRFEIPSRAVPSRVSREGRDEWRLELDADVGGHRLERSFELQVAKG